MSQCRKQFQLCTFSLTALSLASSNAKASRRRKKRSYGSAYRSLDDLGNVIERPNCRLRYQQTSVDVYARFNANDHDSGRTTFLINRRTYLRVTDLVLQSLRVSDVHIASLHGRVLQGRSVGRTEVQVWLCLLIFLAVFNF